LTQTLTGAPRNEIQKKLGLANCAPLAACSSGQAAAAMLLLPPPRWPAAAAAAYE
jgi:hypothetical protein